MTWQAYDVVFRLRSPLHIGWGKLGNLQRTRPYITGRVFWGALTMRLTRDQAHGSAMASPLYQRIGAEVHQSLVYTYFYPATAPNGVYQIAWPWEHTRLFRHRFLSSYSGTALAHPQQSAAIGMLHEVEFLSPHTLDRGEPVFLIGYVFAHHSCTLKWQEACNHMQLGGERGYGWGQLELITSQPCGNDLFYGKATFDGTGRQAVVAVSPNPPITGQLLAHAYTEKLQATGEVEPLVGREWRSDNTLQRYAGQHVAYTGICFAPGSTVEQQTRFVIEAYGIWRQASIV